MYRNYLYESYGIAVDVRVETCYNTRQFNKTIAMNIENYLPQIAAKHLLDIQRRIAEKGGHPPQSLAIIVGLSSAACNRPDGVYVLPITTLKP